MGINESLSLTLGGDVALTQTLRSFIRVIWTLEFAFLFTFISIIIGSLSLFFSLLAGIILTEYILWVEKNPPCSSRLSISPLLLLVILVSCSASAFTYLRHATHSADALTDTWQACKFIHRKEKSIFFCPEALFLSPYVIFIWQLIKPYSY